MKQELPLSEKERKSLSEFCRYMVIWKWIQIILIPGCCLLFLYFALAEEQFAFIWLVIFFAIYGRYTYNENNRRLSMFEIDMLENTKVRVTGRLVNLVFEEAAQYITFCEDGSTENEIFLLSYKNDRQFGDVSVGNKVELEYAPSSHFLFGIQPVV